MARPRERQGRRGRLGEGLRAARRARGLTQEEAAAELGVGRAALATWESGAERPHVLAQRFLLEVWIPRALEGRKEAQS